MTLSSFEADFVAALMDPASAGPAGIARQAGFAVYRNTVMKGSIDALQANYPAVCRLMGEAWFRAVAREFVIRHPPASPLLVTYGEDFEAYLRGLEAIRELPYLPAVAALDRCWTQCHVAAGAPVLRGDALTGMAPEVMASSRLRPHPAACWRFFQDCPAYSIWSRNRDDDANDDELVWQPEGALLTRPDDVVRWSPLDPGAWLLLEGCSAGKTLGAAADECLARHPDMDLVRTIAVLIQRGAFTAITKPTNDGDS